MTTKLAAAINLALMRGAGRGEWGDPMLGQSLGAKPKAQPPRVIVPGKLNNRKERRSKNNG